MAATAPRTHVFPNDLGQNTYVRETGRNNRDNDAFHFMIFSAVRLSSDTEQFTSVSSIRNTDGSVVDINEGINSRIVDQYTLPRLSADGTYQKTSESNIVLYMPDEVKVNYSADLQQIDQGLMRNYIQAEDAGGLFDAMKESVGHSWKRAGDIGKSALLSVSGALSATELFSLQLAKKGATYNPVSEQLFKNMKMRTFDYNFRLVPRNHNESRTIQNILKEFRFQMHPELAENRKEFKFPSLFVITYWRSVGGKPEENVMLNKISSCYLEDMNVNYSGQKNQFNTFVDGQPVEIDLALKFRETVVHTKESINRGF